MAKKSSEGKRVKVRNVTNHTVHTGEMMILPRQEAEVDEMTARRLEKRGLVQILKGGK